MKKLILLPMVLIVALGFSSFSGGKCKYDSEKVDKFSDEKTKCNTYKLDVFGYQKIQIGSIGTQNYISIIITLGGEHEEVLSLQDTLAIKLENGKQIKVAPKDECKAVAYVVSNQVMSYYAPFYNFSKKKMERLSESPIVAIKMLIANKPYTFEIKESKASKIMETAACLVSESE